MLSPACDLDKDFVTGPGFMLTFDNFYLGQAPVIGQQTPLRRFPGMPDYM